MAFLELNGEFKSIEGSVDDSSAWNWGIELRDRQMAADGSRGWGLTDIGSLSIAWRDGDG